MIDLHLIKYHNSQAINCIRQKHNNENTNLSDINEFNYIRVSNSIKSRDENYHSNNSQNIQADLRILKMSEFLKLFATFKNKIACV